VSDARVRNRLACYIKLSFSDLRFALGYGALYSQCRNQIYGLAYITERSRRACRNPKTSVRLVLASDPWRRV